MTAHEAVSNVLKLVASHVKPGISTKELNEIAEKYLKENKIIPYNKGYQPNFAKTPFPAALCTSVNDQICHGMPSDYVLQDGNVINLDIGVYVNGLCGDAALSMGVGFISEKTQELLDVAKGAMMTGISLVKNGIRVSDIGSAMNKYCEQRGYVTVRTTSGHTIGLDMHMKPDVPNFYDHNNHGILQTGMIVCIEPQVTKKDRVGKLVSEWDFRTVDGKKSAFFEHMVEVLDDGYEILTTHI